MSVCIHTMMSIFSHPRFLEAKQRLIQLPILLGLLLLLVGSLSFLRYLPIMNNRFNIQIQVYPQTQLLKTDSIGRRGGRFSQLSLPLPEDNRLAIVTSVNGFPPSLSRYHSSGEHMVPVQNLVLHRAQRHVYFIESMHYQSHGVWREYRNPNLQADMKQHFQEKRSHIHSMLTIGGIALAIGLLLAFLNYLFMRSSNKPSETL